MVADALEVWAQDDTRAVVSDWSSGESNLTCT